MSFQFPIKPKFPVPQASNIRSNDQTRSAPAVADDGRAGFSAYVDSMLGGGGFKMSTKDKKSGFVVQSGPMRGMTVDQAMIGLRESYQNLTPEQKRRAIDRGTGADLSPDYKGGPMPSMQSGSGPGGGLRTGSIGGGGLDWLKQNRITGDELRQAEKNVQATGDRNLSFPVKSSPPVRTVSPAQTIAPTPPSATVSPAQPIAPTPPSATVSPAQPIAPTPPSATVSPAQPIAPTSPSATVSPAQPIAPTSPSATVSPTPADYLRSVRAENLRHLTNGTPGDPKYPMSRNDGYALDLLLKKIRTTGR